MDETYFLEIPQEIFDSSKTVDENTKIINISVNHKKDAPTVELFKTSLKISRHRFLENIKEYKVNYFIHKNEFTTVFYFKQGEYTWIVAINE